MTRHRPGRHRPQSDPLPARRPLPGLRRSLVRTFATLALTFLAVGLAGTAALAYQEHAADGILRTEVPAVTADRAALQALTDAETGVRGYLLTGDDRFLQPYRLGRAAFGAQLATALGHADRIEDGGRTAALLTAELRAGRRWLAGWAAPVLADPQPGGDEQQRGKALFDDYRAAHQAAADRLGAVIAGDRQLLDDRAHALIATSAAVLAGALVLGGLSARRAVRRTTVPIERLSQTLSELRQGDPDARVDPDGPRELVELGRAVNDLADEVDRRTSAFVSTVSHELRTPLSSILGYLELMSDGLAGPVPAEQRFALDAVQRNSARLLGLVDDLLTVSLLDSSALPLVLEPLDLRQVAEAALAAAALAEAGEHRDRRIEWHPAAVPVAVLGDAAQLQRVVAALLSNAVTFTPAGGRISLSVRVAADRPCCAELLVTDNGNGIDPAEQRHVFQRFYRPQTTERQAVPGSGLGLAIARGIVQQHGGTITLRSEPGHGTTVSVTLPLAGTPPELHRPRSAAHDAADPDLDDVALSGPSGKRGT